MHFACVLFSALAAVKTASACVYAHCYRHDCITETDTVSVQIWDNGRVVCWSGVSETLAGADGSFDLTCLEEGITAKMVGLCDRVEYSAGAPSNYRANLTIATDGQGEDKKDDNKFCCANCGDGDDNLRPLNGREYESVLDDHPSCTAIAGGLPNLCDYRSYCDYQPVGSAVYEGQVPPPSSSPPPTQPPSQPGALRVLIVGDSMTQGSEGDFTWRYRMFQWFRDYTDIQATFVGNWTGTKPPMAAKPPQPPKLPTDPDPESPPAIGGAYFNHLTFNDNHFSSWGRQLKRTVPLIQDIVRASKPDIMLLMLGFNDVGWFVSDATGTMQSMDLFIKEARAGKPDIKIAMANIVQRTFIGGRDDLPVKTSQYNEWLPGNITRWSNSTSPIKLVDVAGTYDCNTDSCPAGSDGLHPNGLGDYQLASAFSRTLYEGFGYGRGVLPVPNPNQIPKRKLPAPKNITAVGSPMGVTVTWNNTFGSYGYDVGVRRKGASDFSVGRAFANRYDHTFSVAGVDWEFEVRSKAGDGIVGPWSAVYGARSQRNTPPPPDNLQSMPTSNSLQLTWGNVAGDWNVDRFAITIWDKDTAGSFIQVFAVPGSARSWTAPADVVKVGHRYDIFMSSWAGPGYGGLPGTPPSVITGGGTPDKVTGFVANSVDATTVQLTWNKANNAAAYRISITGDSEAGGGSSNGTLTPELSYGASFLYPGTWHYTFCIVGVNGKYESAQRVCRTPKQPS